MENDLQKRYGFWTAVAMVVGIVIGSGVFFKAEKVLQSTGGDVFLGILSWVVSGSIMIVCAYTFAILAGRYEKVNGIVDYAEASLGKTYGYIVGWFMATIYYPALAAVLSWVSAKYTAALFNIGDPGVNIQVYLIAIFYMVAIYVLNIVAPILAGKFQVSATFIKLIPLVLMAIVGLIKGIYTGQTIENFKFVTNEILTSNPLFTSIVATAFAYEGWIVATTINAELKDSRKNLPKALLIGSIAIVVVYVLYFIGLSSSMSINEFILGGEDSIRRAFFNTLGSFGGSTLFIFVVISCIGTLNGLTLACIRGFYSLAARNMGPSPKFFSKINEKNKIPVNSGIVGLIVIMCWLLVWYGSFKGWWGMFLDFSELPVITMYALYIPIFIWTMKVMKDLNFIQRFLIPFAAVIGSIFMIFATFVSHGIKAVFIYIGIFFLIILVGLIFKNNKSKKESL